MLKYAREIATFPSLAPYPIPSAVLLCKTPFRDQLIFSCVSTVGRYASGKRTIVSFRRDGKWHCCACGYQHVNCKHIPHAIAFADSRGLLAVNADGEDDGLEEDEDEMALLLKTSCRMAVKPRHSISHLPIPPPRWCSSSTELLSRSSNIFRGDFCSSLLPLDAASRCACGTSFQDVSVEKKQDRLVRAATVYGLSAANEVKIELISCPSCRHARRSIGPDLSSSGIFNWNNKMLFTHALLNAYTNAFTTSETPFSAWCLYIRRQYQENESDIGFCSDETLVRVWFAFVVLQQLDSGMTCPTCGPTPNVIVVDGISLGTQSSKLVPGIRPPTHVDEASERMETISTYQARNLPAIPQVVLRTEALELLDQACKGDGSALKPSDDFATKYPAYYSFLCLIQSVGRRSPHFAAYRSLAQQAASPDIVLQLIPYDTIDHVVALSLPDFGAPDWLQSQCPAIGAIINGHTAEGTPLPWAVREMAGWLGDRSREVYGRLALHDPGPISEDVEPQSWRTTGTLYGLPPIHSRRVYAKLVHEAEAMKPGVVVVDRDVDDSTRSGCNKYYKSYSKNGLTGGIFVMWCTHSVCLGFHSIPVAEGRNDVFSAIYTHFRTAPEIVIYDFACKLATYCFTREARYFRHTRFLIDELHAHDHHHCGQASLASNVMAYDSRVRQANTSAAECGNKGMKRIRKSVSFMTYEHAVIYTKVFLDIWNRSVTARMGKVRRS